MVKGSTVIEMAYIIPLFFGLFVLIMHAVFYYHDILGAQAARRADTEYDLESFFEERTNGKLIYMTDTDLSISETEDKITVSVSAQRSLMSMEISQSALIVKPEKNIRRMR